MTVFNTIQGTSNTEFRIGLTGPTIYQGSADPTVTPPTPLADGFRDGDVYFRTATGGAAIWVIDGGSWTQIASGAAGGSFSGDIIMNPSAQFLGDGAAGAGAPAYAFDGDEDTGMFNPSPDEIGFSVGGNQAFVIESDGTLASTTAGYEALVLADNDIPNRKYVEDTFLNVAGDNMTGDLTFDPGTQLFAASGSVTDPCFAWALDPDTGMFLDGGFGANAQTFTAGGTAIMTVLPAGTTMRGGTQFAIDPGTDAAPGFTFSGDSDSGIFQSVPGQVEFTIDGTEVIQLDSTDLTGTLRWRGPAGTALLPAVSFAGDPNTGLYNSTGDELTIAAGGADALVIDTDSVVLPSTHTLMLPDGLPTLPAINFVSDSDTGIYHNGTGNTLSIATAGAELARFDADQLRMVDGTGAFPAYSFINNDDMGMYRFGADQLGFSVLGTPQIIVESTNVRFNQQIRMDEGNQSSILPGYSFTGDPDTGMYNGGGNELGFTTGGSPRWQIETNGDFLPQGTTNTLDIGSPSQLVNTVYATTFDGTATAAQYSDLAERYTVGDCCQLEPGDVVVICEHEDHDICLSGEKEGDTAVLGVVSTAPAFMMNKDAGTDEEAPYIALRGRVPVKVCGDVKEGDLLITCGRCDCHDHARVTRVRSRTGRRASSSTPTRSSPRLWRATTASTAMAS